MPITPVVAGSVMNEIVSLLLQGTWVTLQVSVSSAALAIVIAIAVAGAQRAPSRTVRWCCHAYVEVLRGLPLLVLLFWLFFVLPLPPFYLELSPWQVAIAGIGLHFGAYGAEVLRGAFKTVPQGQFEAAHALNFPPWRAFRLIILPQVLRAAMAPGTNLLIELVKNTSLVSLITLADLSFRAKQLNQTTFQTTTIYALTLALYFLLAQSVRLGMHGLNQRLTGGRRSAR